MKKIITLSIVLGITLVSFGQQIPKFTAVQANPYLINPAYAGFKDSTKFFLHYRNEMLGVRGGPNSALVSIDGHFKESNVGLGLNAFKDRVNIIDRDGFNLSYSYKLKMVNNQKLIFGLSAGAVHNSIAMSQIVAENPNELMMFNNYKPTTGFNADLGLVYGIQNLEVGFSVANLLNRSTFGKNDFSFEQKQTYFISGMYHFNITTELISRTSVVFRGSQGMPMRFDANAVVSYKDKMWAGFTYGLNSNAGISAGVNYENFSFGYIYEYPISSLHLASGGSNEIFIGYTIPNR